MPNYSQAGRSLQITTPLGADQLLLVGFRGQESISRLFRFELDLLADVNIDIAFEDIIGQSVTIQLLLPSEDTRYFNGIVKRFVQGASDDTFTVYHAEVVPKPWLLAKTVQSRIFQNMSVSDILNEVLSGFDFTLELSETYYPRNYCVQYRESDFDFASRLMEDEGIYYYFDHSDGAHQMVVTDAKTSYPEVAEPSTVIYEPRRGGAQESIRIRTWEKAQEILSNQYTLGEYCFEMPTSELEQSTPIIDTVQVGTVTHKFNLAGQELEIYDYPAGCAKRYDGVDNSGGTFAAAFAQMSADRSRIVRVRMEEEECAGLEVTGTSDCGNFSAGYMFTLDGHNNGDGDYLLTRVEHHATLTGYRTEEPDDFKYDNRFAAMPTALVYRPRRVTAKPVIAGFQTATVTGMPGDTSSGQSVYCDQYGRVKVQFHWDREGTMDSNGSCWLRVAQVWAGNGWGAFFWPRSGNEVVVAFEEGDPDQPMIVGSVYNAANTPPFSLPDSSQLGGIRSASVSGSSGQNFNGIVFNDTLGAEHLAIHSENNMSLNAEKDKMFHGGGNKGERVAVNSVYTVGGLPGVSGGGSGGGPTASPSSLDFGSLACGTPSAPQTVTVTGASGTLSTNITGTNASDYSCASSLGSGSYTLTVIWTPSVVGPSSATLTITDSTGATYTVALSGTGEVSYSPTSLSFGDQNTGTASAAQTVTLTWGGSLSIASIAFTGTNAGDYAQTNTLGLGTCTISVTFTPSATGSSTATMTVTDSSGNTYDVDLSGNGTTPGTGFSEGNTLAFSPPAANSGLDVSAVYGADVCLYIGQYFELVLGAAETLVVDPMALFTLIPPVPILSSFFAGSGMGGVSNVTLGTSANFQLGPSASMTLTPTEGGNTCSLTATYLQCTPNLVLCGLMASLVIIWAVLYAGYQGLPDDSPVVELVTICQAIAGVLQGAIMGVAESYQEGLQLLLEDANGVLVAVPALAGADAAATQAAADSTAADKDLKDADDAIGPAETASKDAEKTAKTSEDAAKDAETTAQKAEAKAQESEKAAKDADPPDDDLNDQAARDRQKADDDEAKVGPAKQKAKDDRATADAKEKDLQTTKEDAAKARAKAAKAKEKSDAAAKKAKAAKTKAEKAQKLKDKATAKAQKAQAKSDQAYQDKANKFYGIK